MTLCDYSRPYLAISNTLQHCLVAVESRQGLLYQFGRREMVLNNDGDLEAMRVKDLG